MRKPRSRRVKGNKRLGQQKWEAEQAILHSGLPHTVLRLGAIVAPDGGKMGADVLTLIQGTPRDTRIHAVDVVEGDQRVGRRHRLRIVSFVHVFWTTDGRRPRAGSGRRKTPTGCADDLVAQSH